MTTAAPPADPNAGRPGRWWRRSRVVLAKEVRDHLRDKRSLVLALIYPLFGPILIGSLLNMSLGSLLLAEDAPKVAGIMRPYNAPKLVRYLHDHGVILIQVTDDPVRLLESARVPVIIDLPDPPAGQPLPVRLMVDLTRVANSATTTAIAEVIRDYARKEARERLQAHGLDPGIIETVSVQQVHVGRRADVTVFFYNLIPALTIFMIFLGAVYLAIDTTVGERERGSWEPLLTAPAQRWELVLGKAGAAFTFTAFSVALNLTAFYLVLSAVIADQPGVTAPPGAAVLALMFLLALPLMALAVMLQISIAAITRSMKEAQIYLGLLPLVPAVPSMIAAFAPLSPSLGVAAVPVLGQMMLFGRLTAGSTMEPSQVVMSCSVTLLMAAFLFLTAIRLFEREKLFFPT